jgi:hypothetical protein
MSERVQNWLCTPQKISLIILLAHVYIIVQQYLLLKMTCVELGAMVYVCNPSNLEGGDFEDHSASLAQAKSE